MTVHIRVRDDADGYYAAHRGEVIGTLDSRAEAEEVCRVALNGDEWEVVGEWTCQACGKPAPEGEPVCAECGQNRRSTPVDDRQPRGRSEVG